MNFYKAGRQAYDELTFRGSRLFQKFVYLAAKYFRFKKSWKWNQMASPFLFLVELYFWKTKKSKLETALL